MKIYAIQCSHCKDIIFSRTTHDFRWCSCGKVAIDGGFDYTRIIGNYGDFTNLEIEIKQTKSELICDYITGTDNFGLIKNYDKRISPRK